MKPVTETHPFNQREPIPAETRVLIVGTAPPPRFSNSACGGMIDLDFEFFYGSGGNYMWVFLNEIAKRQSGQKLLENSFSSEKCCDLARAYLKKHKIWMHDVLQEYQRKPGKETSAADGDIVPPPDAKFTQFRAILEASSIEKLVFTSHLAAKWTVAALENEALLTNAQDLRTALSQWQAIDRGLPIEDYLQRKHKLPFQQATIVDRMIEFHVLPSPSPRAVVSGLTLGRKQEVYEQVLFGA